MDKLHNSQPLKILGHVAVSSKNRTVTTTRGPFLESPGNLSRPISVFGDIKCFLTEVNFC